MKKTNFIRLLVLMMVLITSINQVWGQGFRTTRTDNKTQSTKALTTGAYTGTVYEPFSNATPSQGTTAVPPTGPRRGYDANGNWTPDAEDLEYAGDTTPSDQSPIGEPWVMALFALLFAGAIALRQYKHQLTKSMDMKKSTKFIATLALLLTIGVGQIWGWDNVFLSGEMNSWGTYDYGSSGKGTYYIYTQKNQTFKFKVSSYWRGAYGESEYSIGTGTSYQVCDCDGQNFKYNSNNGIIGFAYDQSTNDVNWRPYIELSRPTIYIRHKWNDGEWENKAMTDKEDGTYTYEGLYSGDNSTNVGPCSSCSSGSNEFKYFSSASLVGDPQKGDKCRFVYNSSGYKGEGGQGSYTGSLTITKLWVVSFNMNGYGSAIDNQYVYPGETASTPSEPSATGYTFGGWYTDEDCTKSFSFSTTITGDITLYAKWTEKSYSLTFSNDGHGSVAVAGATVASGSTATINHHTTKTLAATNNTGYHFNNWTLSGSNTSSVTIGNTSAASTTIKTSAAGAIVTANFLPDTYTASNNLDKNGGDSHGQYTATYDANKITINTAPTKTGYDVTGYYTNDDTPVLIADASGNLEASTDYTTSGSLWNETSSPTLYTHWTAHTYTVTLDANGGSGSASMTVDYDATACKTFSCTYAKTGYTLDGFYTAASNGYKVLNADGSFVSTNSNISSYIGTGDKWVKAANCTLYAVWTPITYSVSFDKNDDDATGTMSNQAFTYDVAQSLTANAFEKDGYSFDGWATEDDGEVVYTNGQSVSNLSSTNSATVTLYAHWTEVNLTDLTFSPASAPGETDVTITPILSGVPTGSSVICWKLYYDAVCSSEVEGITFTDNPSSGGNTVTFTTPAATGKYYVQGIYRAGSDCDGDILNTYSEAFIVESDHTVTVRHMCGSTVIHAPTSVVVPAGGTADVSPLEGDDVFGYEFDSWTLGDGVSTEGSTTDNPIAISAYYNGTLTANYTKKNMIYFKNTLGWSEVYVNLLTTDYWNGTNGSGNSNNRYKYNVKMDNVPGSDDIFYYEYTNISKYVSFTSSSQDGSDNFWGSGDGVNVVFPTRPDANGSNDTECGFDDDLPMFVPASGQTGQDKNVTSTGKAVYFNKGYWRLYEPATGRTGYKIKIYNKREYSSRRLEYELDMTESTTEHGFVEATIELEGNHKYGIKVVRDDGRLLTNTSDTDMGLYESSDYTTLSKDGGSSGDPSNFAAAPMQSTTAGEYTFKLACDASSNAFKIGVKKPAADGDYRVVYQDANHNTLSTQHFSRTITKHADAEDIVSFFIDKDNSESMKFEYISGIDGGSVTWAKYADITLSSYSSVITKDGVYNFYLSQDGSGVIHVDSVRPYTGEFYIRTDAVGGTKWADYRNTAHHMTYSEYSEQNADYTHYWMIHLSGSSNTNVKFVVANDYSAWVSDTIIRQASEVGLIDSDGTNTGDASIRFSYNKNTNEAKRRYLGNSTEPDFLYLVNNAANANDIKVGGVDKHGVNVKFNDRENYIYDIEAEVVPSANVKVKVFGVYNSNTQEFIGHDASGDWSTASNYQQLLSGTGSSLQTIRILYDFKTNRMVAAWEPAGTTEGPMEIDADIMIVREHQESAQNIVLAEDALEQAGSITTAKRIYGVMRFNRWLLNNLSHPEDKTADHAEENPSDPDYYLIHHSPLDVEDQLPTYQRNLYYISFPFDVKVSEIFGFGVYGTHYAIQRYDGAGRAQNGFWIDSDPNWKWVAPNGTLKAYEGYVLSLSLSNMAANKFDVWANRSSEVELYFPSTTVGATIDTEADVVIPALNPEEYACSIERDDRNVKDSYWRCIGVPCYADFSEELEDSEGAIINWQKDDTSLPFIYDINWNDKSLVAYEGSTFKFKAMHSYLAQYGGEIHWKNVVAEHPASIVARQRAENEKDYTYRLELRQGENFCDQTFVRMSDKEEVTTGFDFDQDMWKQKYSSRSNIYTLIGTVEVAGNSMPLSNQTTTVPVGVLIAAEGDYTFAVPDGTSGVGVTLIDSETSIRTNLALGDYTVTLPAGTYDNRFLLEISPITQILTGVENVQGGDEQDAKVRKVMIDGVLYILRDGKVFDARGNRVQ